MYNQIIALNRRYSQYISTLDACFCCCQNWLIISITPPLKIEKRTLCALKIVQLKIVRGPTTATSSARAGSCVPCGSWPGAGRAGLRCVSGCSLWGNLRTLCAPARRLALSRETKHTSDVRIVSILRARISQKMYQLWQTGGSGLASNIFWGIHSSTVPSCTGMRAPVETWSRRSLDGRWSFSSWRFWPSTTYFIFRSWRPIARSRDFASWMLLNRRPWGRFPACFLASFRAARTGVVKFGLTIAASKRVLAQNEVTLTYSLSRRLGIMH